jgi:hypothetical protein
MGGKSYIGEYRDIQRLEDIARKELQKPPAPARRKIFLSFRHEDLDKVNMLRGQAKNENSELDFIDMGLRAPFNSENAEYIRAGIRERIQQSSVTLVMVSKDTYKSEWVNWEIRESILQGKGVVVVNTTDNTSLKMPDAVNEAGEKVKIVPWEHKAIMDAIGEVSK